MRRFFSLVSAIPMIIFWSTLTGSLAPAAVITLSPGPDGGVALVANGSAGFNQFFSSVVPVFVSADNVLGPAGGSFSSATAGGTLVVDSPFSVISVTLFTTETLDSITFSLPSTAFGGATEFQNVTASWPVNVLAFNSLTPGTYGTLFQDTTLEITDVPEPASASMLLLAAAGLAVTTRRRRL